MSAADWLLLRSRPVEFRIPRTVGDTVERLQKAFPPGDAFALAFKPFNPPTNMGDFDGDNVRLRIINVQTRTWPRPELFARIRALDDGCMLVGAIRFDPHLKVLLAVACSGFSAAVGGVTWSISSSLVTAILVASLIAIALLAGTAFSQMSEVDALLREVSTAIDR